MDTLTIYLNNISDPRPSSRPSTPSRGDHELGLMVTSVEMEKATPEEGRS